MLGAAGFGAFSYITMSILLLISLANSLTIQPLQVTLAHVENEKNYVSFTFLSQIGLEIIIILGISVLSSFHFEFLKVFTTYLPFILLLVFGFLSHDFTRKVLLAQNKVKLALFADVITSVVQVTILLGCFFFYKLDIEHAFLYIGLSYIPSFIFALFQFRPSFNSTSKWNEYTKNHIDQGKWLLMTAALQSIPSYLPVFASANIIGDYAFGAFRLVQQMFGVLNILLQTFENYVLPQAARLYKSSASRSKVYLKKISLKAAFAFGIVLFILFVFSTKVITLAGGIEYAEFGYIVKGMAVLYFINFVCYPIRMSVRILVMNRTFFIGYLLSFSFSLISFQYLLENYKLMGVIINLIGNQVIMVIYWQYQLYKKDFVLWK